MNRCAYVGCYRPCPGRFCDARCAAKQARVAAVLAERHPERDSEGQRRNWIAVRRGHQWSLT